MTDSIDTSTTRLIGKDPFIMFYGIVGCLAFVALSVWLIWTAPQAIVAGTFGALSFGLLAVVGIYRLLVLRGPVITLSPDGIRDTRVSDSVFPWHGVLSMAEWSFKGRQLGVELTLRPDVDASIQRTALERMLRGSVATQKHGVVFGAGGVLTTHEELKALIEAYFRSHGDLQTTRQ